MSNQDLIKFYGLYREIYQTLEESYGEIETITKRYDTETRRKE